MIEQHGCIKKKINVMGSVVLLYIIVRAIFSVHPHKQITETRAVTC